MHSGMIIYRYITGVTMCIVCTSSLSFSPSSLSLSLPMPHAPSRDWRYKLELCQLTGSPPLYLHSNSCRVPSILHGKVQSISHTHSITKSSSPFKMKISLTCDPGYYLNQTNSLAVCENGTWTKHPTCLGNRHENTFSPDWWSH